MSKKFAEYIWLDGTQPSTELRSKTRVIEVKGNVDLDTFPEWGFDGSSTNQATGDNSDCILRPVSFVKDPIRDEGNFLVMCEVFDRDGNAHETNTRAVLRNVLEAGAAKEDPCFGFEQEYTMYDDQGPLGWPENGFPGPQGPYYCGVGHGRIFGRELVEAHQQACVDAGLLFYGVNAEVMLGQWEFQIGYRGFDEPADALLTTDHLWFASWIMHRIGEEVGIRVSFDNKPIASQERKVEYGVKLLGAFLGDSECYCNVQETWHNNQRDQKIYNLRSRLSIETPTRSRKVSYL